MKKTCEYCEKEFYAKRNSRKYCSDSCKQLSYYKRNNLLQGINSGNTTADKEITTVKKQPLIVKQTDAGINGKNEYPAVAKQEKEFQWVESKLLNKIEDYFTKERITLYFQYPNNYYSSISLPTIKWVTLRFRCLIESMVKLTSYTTIDAITLLKLSKAFNSLVSSDEFKDLPVNYPFTDLITELQQKIKIMAITHKHSEKIPFRMSLQRKSELIAIRFGIGKFVPRIKFSELEFKEQEENTEEF